MDRDVAFYEQIQEMIATGQFSLAYILGVVQSSDRLTDDQKVKMRDQVTQQLQLS